eukprot:TRINITY_DN2122_c2_g1_i1.p2 TRINITY_DN2122_c2_g1~~TRINITY_DN2122_c2_g1_i1.p2  ORF type:complete len:181 (+),score=90.45 TRINITY_DN2122_c2_g1_i1:56-544(+)
MPKAAKLRSSLEDANGVKAGTVCILLAGRFRGRRVVLLKKDTKTNTLVVTGPYKVNGVPIRRVDPAYVIATSTKLDVSKLDTSAITDDFFARPKKDRKKGEDGFFKKGDKAEKTELPAAKKQAQEKVDEQIMKLLSGNEDMTKYLGSIFTLRDHDLPHTMKF